MGRASLEQLQEMLKKKKEQVAKKTKPKADSKSTLLQKLAAKVDASGSSSSKSKALLPVAQADDNRDEDDDEDDADLPEEPGKSDKQKTASEKDKKSKRKKKKKKKSSSDSSDDSKSSEDADLGLFGDAGRGTIGLASKLERVAARRPGRLLRFTLDAMQRSLRPASEGVGEKRPPIMFQYLQQAMGSRHRLDGRNQKELTTIALACDHILKGSLERGLAVLAQRFKRIEAQATGVLDGPTAERLEITPRLEVSSLSPAEREEAIDLERRWQRYQRKDGRPSRSPSRANY